MKTRKNPCIFRKYHTYSHKERFLLTAQKKKKKKRHASKCIMTLTPFFWSLESKFLLRNFSKQPVFHLITRLEHAKKQLCWALGDFMETLRKQDARDPKCKSESAATHLAEHEVPSLDRGSQHCRGSEGFSFLLQTAGCDTTQKCN